MKIIKIYSSWNQLKLKARAGHYNTEAHVRIWVQGRWEQSEGGGDLRQRRQHKTFIGEKCAPGPRCEVSWALDRLRDNGGYQCLHQECVSNIRATITITTLTASQQYNLANIGDDGDITGQARLCVSVCSEMGDKCLALGDIMWHQSPGDQGAGQLGSPADCLGWSELMCHDDTRLLIITHLNVLLRWIQFAGPLHSRNMPLISNPGDWFTVDTVLTHEQIHFQYLFWFLGLLQLLLTQMMRFRCHDSKLWDDYCYYN